MSNRLLVDRLHQVQAPAELVAREQKRVVDAEMRIAGDIASVLERHYAGHQWSVGADLQAEIAYLSIPTLMGATLKWVLHLDKIMDPLQLSVAVMKAGGEILERFNIPRDDIETGLSEFLSARDTKAVEGVHAVMPTG